MSECNTNKREIKDFFNRKSGKVSLDNLRNITGDLSSNKLMNYLFQLVSDCIQDYKGNENLNYVLVMISCIEEVIAVNPSINRKIIYRKIKKIYEKIDSKLDEDKKKFHDYKYAKKELEKVMNAIDSLYDILENKESKAYDFVSYVINDAHDLDAVEKTFEGSKNIVNIKDKSGVSLFNNIISKYLEAIQNPIENDKELLYYNNLINLIKEQKNFKLQDSDKQICLQKAYVYLNSLSAKDKTYEKKCFWLENLIHSLKDEVITKEELATNLAVKHNISTTFSKNIMDEVNFYQTDVSNKRFPDRYIVDEYILSIDDSYTMTVDDALSCRKLEDGNYLLGVHVADILGYYPFGSDTVKEAIQRVSPIYLSDISRYPIFPDEIIKKQVTLLDDDMPRLARSYFFKISPDGEIVDSKILKTIIKNNEKANYKGVDNIISRGDFLGDTLESVFEVMSIRDKAEKKNGDISSSNKLINEIMHFVNSQVGNYFYRANYPCIYLNKVVENQDKNRAIINKLKDSKNGFLSEEHRNLIKTINCMCPKVRYSLNGERDDNDMLHYATITSPLRKSSDILVNHAMDLCYFNNPTDKELYELENFLQERVNYMNEKLDSIKFFTMEYEKNKEKIKKI